MSLLPFPAHAGNRRLGATGTVWAGIAATLLASLFLYRDHGDQPSPTNWLFHSWPALLALGTACLLFQRSPALRWPPFWTALAGLGFQDRRTLGWMGMIAGMVWLLLSFRTAFGGLRLPFAFGIGRRTTIASTPRPHATVTRRSVTFADIGGYDAVKEQLRQVIENRLHPGKFGNIVRNGILLHGPQGSGKTALARAAAGEFRLNYLEVSSPSLFNSGSVKRKPTSATRLKWQLNNDQPCC